MTRTVNPAVRTEISASVAAPVAPVAPVVAPAYVEQPSERVAKDLSKSEIGTFKVAWPTVSSGSSAAVVRTFETEDVEDNTSPTPELPEAVVTSMPVLDDEIEGPSDWLINTRVAEALMGAAPAGSVEQYLDDRGDVIRLHLRLDEEEFRRLTSSSNASHFQEWAEPTEP